MVAVNADKSVVTVRRRKRKAGVETASEGTRAIRDAR